MTDHPIGCGKVSTDVDESSLDMVNSGLCSAFCANDVPKAFERPRGHTRATHDTACDLGVTISHKGDVIRTRLTCDMTARTAVRTDIQEFKRVAYPPSSMMNLLTNCSWTTFTLMKACSASGMANVPAATKKPRPLSNVGNTSPC